MTPEQIITEMKESYGVTLGHPEDLLGWLKTFEAMVRDVTVSSVAGAPEQTACYIAGLILHLHGLAEHKNLNMDSAFEYLHQLLVVEGKKNQSKSNALYN